MKVLVVEDEDSVRQALTTILTSYGHKVTAASDVAEGLMLFDREGGFDIVFTDLSLPGPSGWELADEVKRRSPATPVVLLSGWDIHPEELAARKSVSLMLAKPVKIKEMIQAINNLVG